MIIKIIYCFHVNKKTTRVVSISSDMSCLNIHFYRSYGLKVALIHQGTTSDLNNSSCPSQLSVCRFCTANSWREIIQMGRQKRNSLRSGKSSFLIFFNRYPLVNIQRIFQIHIVLCVNQLFRLGHFQ